MVMWDVAWCCNKIIYSCIPRFTAQAMRFVLPNSRPIHFESIIVRHHSPLEAIKYATTLLIIIIVMLIGVIMS